jgi:ATP-binding cassette subfamily F protein 3
LFPRRPAAGIRQQLAPLRKAVTEVEKRIEKLTAAKVKIETKLADPKLYEGPGEAVTRLQVDLADLSRQIESEEAEWLELHERLETAQSDLS